MFVIDINGAGQEGKDHKQPHETLSDLIRELQLYDEEMLRRPMLVFANKYDTKGKCLACSQTFASSIIYILAFYCFFLLIIQSRRDTKRNC
jgi:GTPase involved in cell partitioning and DNA repair